MSDDARADVPALVPARMVNEFAYCPRLFYLEWVNGQFEHNADTVEGDWRHRAVDVVSGRAPLPDDGELLRATSVDVASEQLGLIAKIDIVEGTDGKVRPVDVKKGRPPSHGPAWEPEMVQSCVQGLLLREAGYKCDEGILAFAGTKERRTIPFDEELETRTLRLVRDLRVVAAAPFPPAPLIDSPKCPRCSLVGICLPDEVNLLNDRADRPPRRLLPRADAARPLYVTEPGLSVGWRSGRVVVSRRSEVVAEARVIDVSQINVIGNAQVSTQLIRECFRREIPICWFSGGGWFSGMATGLPSKHVELRRRQVAVASQSGLTMARQVVAGKIKNCRVLLRRNSRALDPNVIDGLARLAAQALEALSVESLLGFEGAAARLYFGEFSTMLSDAAFGFDFEGRNRRPPKDPVNCLLSFLYALTVKDLVAVCVGVGFDPYMGFYHRPRFGRPALALDLAEEFRPLIADSVAVNVINNGEIGLNHFISRAGAFALTDEGRRKVLAAYERRLETEVTHPVFRYKVTYRRVYEVQARMLAAHMLGETPAYIPMRTR